MHKKSLTLILCLAALLTGAPTVHSRDALQHQAVVEGPVDFRAISLLSWRGIPRLGVPNNTGLADPVAGKNLQIALHNNKELAKQLGDSLELHNYSLGLLALLDYMRVNPDCFANMGKYKALVPRCSDTLIQHNAQSQPWNAYIKNMALALLPSIQSELFCPFTEGKSGCGANSIGQIREKDTDRRLRPLDEFERRDFFSTLMKGYQDNFDTLWRNSSFPGEAWFVEMIRLSEYDFDKQRYVFNISPPGSLTNYQFPLIYSPASVKISAFQSKMFAISPQYIATNDFEKDVLSGGQHRFEVNLPMSTNDARALGQSNQSRTFYAVTKLQFLPRKPIHASAPLSGANKLEFSYAQNKVELYRDSALMQKVAERPLTEKVITTSDGQASLQTLQWPSGQRIFDSRAYALLRIQQGDLANDQLQILTNSVTQAERKIWRDHAQRLEALDQVTPAASTEAQQEAATSARHRAEDRAKLSHLSWQGMDDSQKKTLYAYMLGEGDNQNSWPASFPAVSWGINAATIFKKGHFSIDQSHTYVPATEAEKAVLRQFLQEFAQHYATDKLTLIYDLYGTQYNNKSQLLELSSRAWPFHIRPHFAFDDDTTQKFTSAGFPLVNAGAKALSIYPFSTSTSSVGDQTPNPAVAPCKRNQKQNSTDCVTGYSHFLQGNWAAASFALDRILPLPELKLEPAHASRLMNSGTRGKPGWRLIVELDNVEMKLSPYEYKVGNQKAPKKAEAQTVFASVKKATILAPNGETVWEASSESLDKALDRSKLEAEGTASYTWASPVVLFNNGQPNRVMYDFLLTKYYPQRLNQHFLEAMFSSRWIYEKSTEKPIGSRYFNQDARKPTLQEVGRSLPQFKQWLIQRAANMPNNINVSVPIRYANNTVVEQTQCVKLQLTPNSPLRNNSTAQLLANQKVRQCITNENQLKSQFNRCESLRADLSAAQVALSDAQQAGCQQTVENAPRDTMEISATGSCDFSVVDFSQMQTAMQACMKDRCGEIPTNMAKMTTYQTCAQAVSTELQEQLRAALTGGRSKPKAQPKNTVMDHCKPHQRDIRNTEGRLKSHHCDTLVAAPVPVDCSVLGDIEVATHMHVERLQFRGNPCVGDAAFNRKGNPSALLLPHGRPYSDTQIEIEIDSAMFKVPYDPPYEVDGPSNAVLTLELDIQLTEDEKKPAVLKFESVIRNSTITAK